MTQYAIGIDLGTTNSCVAVFEGNRPILIANKAGYKTTPSMVAITDQGKRLVGQLAKRQAITNAVNTVYSIKRLIGRRIDSPELKNSLDVLPYEVVEGPHGDIRVLLQGEIYSLPEISAFVLNELKGVAEEHFGVEIKDAIITAPAYFNDDQRQATIDAGKIAGLDVLRIINEPTAAALAYGYQSTDDQTLVVFDLGGGTFDVSVLQIEEGVFSVLSTLGDTFLGGEDFDMRIIEKLIYDFALAHHVDLRGEKMAMQRLKMSAEKAKCDLSSMQSADISIPFIWTTQDGEALHIETALSRNEFEEAVFDLVKRCIKILQQAIINAGLTVGQIDDILLIGGMTRMPLIQKAVTEFFGKAPSKGINPDEAVALGAAIQADALVNQNDDILLLDVTPLDLGIAVHGGGFHVIVPQNTSIPTAQSTVFTTSSDNQSQLKIIVLQGDSKTGEQQVLSEFTFSGIQAALAGEVDIDVRFSIDSDGIVQVTAQDLKTKKTHEVTVSRSSKLTTDELQAMLVKQEAFLLKEKEGEAQDSLRAQFNIKMRELKEMLTLPIPQEILAFGERCVEELTSLSDSEPERLQDHIQALKRACEVVSPYIQNK